MKQPTPTEILTRLHVAVMLRCTCSRAVKTRRICGMAQPDKGLPYTELCAAHRVLDDLVREDDGEYKWREGRG